MRKKSHLIVTLILLATFSVACSKPMTLALMFSPNTDMNGGNALQVVLFELSGNATFENTPVDSFWEGDNAVLVGDLVSPKQKITLFPDRPQSLNIQPSKEATYIGVAANYRSPDAQGWRVIFSIEELKGKNIELTAEENRFFARLQ